MAFSTFVDTPSLNNFDCDFLSLLLAENRLLAWIGEKKKSGEEIRSLDDFFQENYFSKQINAFLWGLDTTPDELNFAWINHLHFLATNNLFHEFGQPIHNRIRRHNESLEFCTPVSQIIKGFADKASPSGIENLAKEISDFEDEETQGKTIFFIKQSFQDHFPIEIIDAKTAKRIYEEQQKIVEKNKDFIKKNLEQGEIKPASIFASAWKITDREEFAYLDLLKKLIPKEHILLSGCVGYCLLNKNPFQIRSKAEKIIHRYNQASKQTEDEKIDAIIILAKGLLNLHVWSDGNGRLCAHQLLNLLLIKNNLPPTFLVNNCLDAFEIRELRDRVKEGMKSFSAKCNKNINNNLEKYRTKNNLPISKESDFIIAIIHNKLDAAKTLFYEMVSNLSLTKKDLEFFTSCVHAHMDWFGGFFKDNQVNLLLDDEPVSKNQLIQEIVSLGLRYANENLLRSALELCIINNIILSADLIVKITTDGNFKLFKLCKNILVDVPIQKYMLYRTIPFCSDREVASELMNNLRVDLSIKPSNRFALEAATTVTEIFDDIFKFQSPSIILEYFAMDAVKHLLKILYPEKLSQCINFLKKRDDLTNEEKNLVIGKINPDCPLIPIHSLDHFVHLFASTEQTSSKNKKREHLHIKAVDNLPNERPVKKKRITSGEFFTEISAPIINKKTKQSSQQIEDLENITPTKKFKK